MKAPLPILFALVACIAIAQQTPPLPVFDAASVKVSPPIGGTNNFVGMRIDPGRIHIANFGLEPIIMRAYGVQGDQMVGTPNEFRYPLAYEITATFPADTAQDQIPLMLQSLLADRFKLVVHRETRVLPVYFLVVAKNGPKLQVSHEDKMFYRNPRRGHVEEKKVNMSSFAQSLHSNPMADRPVIDKTGLTGDYDFTLDWTPNDATSGDLSAPSLFTALQEQMGLKLEAQNAPREVLVIDHAEKPTEN